MSRFIQVNPAQVSLGGILLVLNGVNERGLYRRGVFFQMGQISNYANPAETLVALRKLHKALSGGQIVEIDEVFSSVNGQRILLYRCEETSRVLQQMSPAGADILAERLKEWMKTFPAVHAFLTRALSDEDEACAALDAAIDEWRAHSRRQQFSLV